MNTDRFKFRVWDCKNERYFRGDNLFIDSYGNTYEDTGYNQYELDLLYDSFVIEQCTGLKDKHGNLIYEGDVLKAILHNFRTYEDEIEFYKVEFIGNGLRVVGINGNFDSAICWNGYPFEIIGNIHDEEEKA